jgi:D-cysteine desulfhydrase family pyridoxal phosphate-dependent enzyme
VESMRLGAQPRVALATLPTPVQEARRLRDALGGRQRCPRILLKRDDLTGLALGGNKARKLEFLAADALRTGATVLVTVGAAQSNHARMTAAAARICGLRCVLVLTAAQPAPLETGNLLLDRLLGAEVRLLAAVPGAAAAMEAAEADAVARAVAELAAAGERPYVIPVGGSDAVGTLGYVAATVELAAQLAELRESPVALYHASGSRGTQAGLELGARLVSVPYRVQGIAVSPGGPDKQARAVRLMEAAAERLGCAVQVEPGELLTDEEEIGAGYGIPTDACLEALRLVARTEGILLDPVYSAKGMAGLIRHVREGRIAPDATALFLHTGGAPGLFAHAPALLAAAATE